MNRREFLTALAAGLGVVKVVFDPERALWIPGKKHISIPAVRPPVFDPRFLVHVKAGKAGPYRLPSGVLVRRVNQKLPQYEVAVEMRAPWELAHMPVAAGPLAYSASVWPEFGGPELHLWPVPTQDAVLAVAYERLPVQHRFYCPTPPSLF